MRYDRLDEGGMAVYPVKSIWLSMHSESPGTNRKCEGSSSTTIPQLNFHLCWNQHSTILQAANCWQRSWNASEVAFRQPLHFIKQSTWHTRLCSVQSWLNSFARSVRQLEEQTSRSLVSCIALRRRWTASQQIRQEEAEQTSQSFDRDRTMLMPQRHQHRKGIAAHESRLPLVMRLSGTLLALVKATKVDDSQLPQTGAASNRTHISPRICIGEGWSRKANTNRRCAEVKDGLLGDTRRAGSFRRQFSGGRSWATLR